MTIFIRRELEGRTNSELQEIIMSLQEERIQQLDSAGEIMKLHKEYKEAIAEILTLIASDSSSDAVKARLKEMLGEKGIF